MVRLSSSFWIICDDVDRRPIAKVSRTDLGLVLKEAKKISLIYGPFPLMIPLGGFVSVPNLGKKYKEGHPRLKQGKLFFILIKS